MINFWVNTKYRPNPYENPYVWCCFFAFVGANLVFARALIGKIRIAVYYRYELHYPGYGGIIKKEITPMTLHEIIADSHALNKELEVYEFKSL